MITRRYQALFHCDRCGFTLTEDVLSLPAIYYGDPSLTRDDVEFPCILLPSGWAEYMGGHFCSKCVPIAHKIVKIAWDEIKILEKPKKIKDLKKKLTSEKNKSNNE